MKEIPLTNGGTTSVDNATYALFSKLKWHKGNHGYACYGVRINGKYQSVLLHRLVLKAPLLIEIDHINGDKLDNRKCNLRFATRQQQSANSRKQKRLTTSKFKGVSWFPRTDKWRAQLHLKFKNGRKRAISIGYYTTEIEAAQAYNTEAVHYFGKFAHLNVL